MSRQYLSHIDSEIKPVNLKDHDKAVFVLHDQLNLDAWPSWIREEKPLLIFIEAAEKGKALPYHKKKLIYLLSSMRHFALECMEAGFPVLYHSTRKHYDDRLSEILSKHEELALTYMTPSEWDSRERVGKVKRQYENRVKEIPNNFFLADADEYKEKVADGWLMEYFYRDMRRKTGYLMNGDQPEGGEWNYDEDNREKLPKDHPVPEIAETEVDEITQEVIDMVEDWFPDHFGESEGFTYAVTRRQALYRLNEFIDERLDEFGPYEDAMAQGKYDLFHSHLSLYMNNGLILPKEVCDKAEEAYRNGEARLNSVEGFIRQVIGWREYVRVYYEAMMPEVREANHFNFTNKLPEMYWSGETKMNCMSECLKPVIKEGYSHHIPRLMVLSNFSNLTETDPRELNRWFHLAYVDAYEWVVLPNVLGMSTFADGGVLASKPYISSGNYINKMSDYCKHCEYKISKKTGEDACPFNYLYWNFIDKQRETFSKNGRSNFMVNMFDKRDEEDKKAIWESSEKFIESLNRE
ncbi:MAG: cryptochrome/photolyase family protein [Balneola sp.]|jgi:deoxyribodipyrimidine photolyase-related protein|nr:cryptochrome/photolyase family protein [Balneola sp.]MBE78440.1 cryptochrome/photolyase family protein [Balneola sp.]|tara:strand:+ start:863 stop:2428 length:1566 start_codon:yes stop_codon:yes gene_type:complete